MRLTADHYPTVLMTAVVAGVFSAVVCVLLLAGFGRRSTELPLAGPEFAASGRDSSRTPMTKRCESKSAGLISSCDGTTFGSGNLPTSVGGCSRAAWRSPSSHSALPPPCVAGSPCRQGRRRGRIPKSS